MGTEGCCCQRKEVAIPFGILVPLLVLGGTAAAVYFTWPKPNDTPTAEPSTSTSRPTGTIAAPQLVQLFGSFTILNKTIEDPDVTNASICSYLKNILTGATITTKDCAVLDLRNGSVKVRYKVVFEQPSNQNIDTGLKLASSAIAGKSWDTSVYLIDQTSITFENKDGIVENNCPASPCSDVNSVCVSAVKSYACVCLNGYIQVTGENSCEVRQAHRYCAPTKTWIPDASICNNYQDCPDDVDEINCPCNSTYQYACQNGRCIYKAWFCDGVVDCPMGDDENQTQCTSCPANEFLCSTPRRCIPSSSVCNGISDCSDSSDESHCLTMLNDTSATKTVTVTYGGVPDYFICSDNFNLAWRDAVCKYLGFGNATDNTTYPVTGSFVTVNPMASSANLMTYFTPSNCSSGLAVRVSCMLSPCGVRTVSSTVGPYIIDGQKAARGAWPWQVLVWTGRYNSDSTFSPMLSCGGILISDRWILTAAHCTRIDEDVGLGYTGETKPENILIMLGAISQKSDPDKIYSRADRVYPHPLYNRTIIDNDVGLIRLSRSVTFTDTIRPICLPAPDQDLSRFRVCVDTGFGKTILDTGSNDLLQARMDIIPYSVCTQYNPRVRNNTQICVGTVSPDVEISLCNGDSGGPFACQDQNGVWLAIGVNSYVSGRSGPAALQCHYSFVARVTAFLDWIQSTIAANSV